MTVENPPTGPDGDSEVHAATVPSGGDATVAGDPDATISPGQPGAQLDLRPGGRLGSFVVERPSRDRD